MEGLVKKLPRYYPYLEDIRRRLYKVVLFFIFFFLVGLLNSGFILKWIIHTFKLENADVVITSPFQFLDLAMSVGLYTGLILSTPLFIYHLYSFLKDGLNASEKKFFFVLLPLSFALFLGGFIYCFVILSFTLDSIATYNIGLGIKNFWDVGKFLMQIILTSALLGMLFQFPLILTFLTKMGLISSTFLREKRRHAIAIMFLSTAFLPPTDGLSLLIMVLPLLVIYEITIRINSVVEQRQQRHQFSLEAS